MKKKVAVFSAGVAVFFISSILLWFWSLSYQIQLTAETVAAVEVDMVLHKWQIELYSWLIDLQKLAHQGKEFKRELDPTECRFGQWYYSFKLPYENPSFIEPFKNIGELHKQIHWQTKDIIRLSISGERKALFNFVNSIFMGTIKSAEEQFGLLDSFMDKKQADYKLKLRILNYLQYFSIVFFGLCGAGFIFYGLKQANDISRSILDLSSATGLVAKGIFDISLLDTHISEEKYIPKMDEIGILQNAFKKMAIDLQERTGLLSALAKSSPLAFVTCDLKKLISFYSPAAEKLTGYASQEVLGKSIEILMPEKYKEKHRKAFVTAVKRGTVKQIFAQRKGLELPLLLRSGEEIPCEIYLSEIFGQGDELMGFSAIIMDLREKKSLQMSLLHSEKLVAIGQLSAGVAHELNNPLTTIIGTTELLLEESKTEVEKTDLNTIKEQAERCRRIIQNLLQTARSSKPESKLVQINNVLQRTLRLVEYDLKTSGVKLNVELDPRLPEILTDEGEIHQVFLNILANARDALQNIPSAQILVKTKFKESSNEEKESKALVSFIDNGVGISEAHLKKIFDPFFTTKEPGKGTGLGLSISYEIIKKHGGRICVNSKVGEGTEFCIEFPVLAS